MSRPQRGVRSSIKILGWAPKGEPVPKGPRNAEFFLKLSALPDAVWQRAFIKHAEPLSGVHRHELVYELIEDTLRVWCPVPMIASVVENAKHLVSSANIDAREFDQQLEGLRIKEVENHDQNWAGIEAEKSKIHF